MHQKAQKSLADFEKKKEQPKQAPSEEPLKKSTGTRNPTKPMDGLNQLELDQIQKDLQEAQSQADEYTKEKDAGPDKVNQQTKAENMEASGLETVSEVESEQAAEEYVSNA